MLLLFALFLAVFVIGPAGAQVAKPPTHTPDPPSRPVCATSQSLISVYPIGVPSSTFYCVDAAALRGLLKQSARVR